MTKQILAGVALLILGFGGFVATRPAAFSVVRQTTVAVPPEAVYALLSDFHHWQSWSPWEELDPKMVRTHEGAASGTGAIYGWKGNSDVGEGRMTITEAKPHALVVIKLEFLKPFAATHTTTLTLAGGPQTEVAWKMEGNNGLLSKAFTVFQSMDTLVGKDFEKGLAKLKAVAEKPPTPAAPPSIVP